jgi:hypothetical protein
MNKKILWNLFLAFTVVVVCVPIMSALAQEITVTATIDTVRDVEIKLATKFISAEGKEAPFLYSGKPGVKALTVKIPWKKGYKTLWVRGMAKILDTEHTDEWEYCSLTIETDKYSIFPSTVETYISKAQKSENVIIKVDNSQNSDYKPQFYVKWAKEDTRKAWRKANEKFYENVDYPIHIESIPWEMDFKFVEARAKWIKHYTAVIVDGYELISGTRIKVGQK